MKIQFPAACRAFGSFLVLVAFAFLLLSNASATENWVGGTNTDWSTKTNWSGGAVPGTGDNVYINAQTASDSLTLSAATNQPNGLFFTGNGYGFTIGTSGSSSNELVFADQYHGLDVLSALAANNTTETIAAPMELQGRFYIGNFSPELSSGMGIRGVAGYGNLLLISGNIILDASDATNMFLFAGNGDITVSGNILPNPGTAYAGILPTLSVDTMGKFTLSGTNTYGGSSTFGGRVVFDYTTNNTNKMVSTTTLYLGNNSNGGRLTIKGNATNATSQTVGAYNSQRGENSIEVDGGSATATATLTLNGLTTTTGGLTDFNTNSYGTIKTTTANTGSGATATNIIGSWATFGQTYWATNSGGTIVGLTSDNGHVFNSQYGNYTVYTGSGSVETLSGTEGANTIRFTSGGTLDLGGGTLTMYTGGIMATSGVTASTTVSDGSLSVTNTGGAGLDIYNYGTGTLTVSAGVTTNTSIAKGGSGNVVLSGNNSAIYGQQIDILSGTLTIGSANALGASTYTGAPSFGIGNSLVFGDGTATLDTAGYNVYLNGLNSDNNMTPGNQAAALGLNSQIVNSKAGTLSTIRVAGTSNMTPGGNHASTTGVSGTPVLGSYEGGLNEAAGAILAIDIEQGTATGQVQLNLGTANPIGDPTGSNSYAASGLTGANDVFTGAVTVGTGANLGFSGYSDFETTGVLTLNGIMGQYTNQLGTFAVGYLTGTGSFLSNQIFNLFVDTRGSVTDTFAGTFGTNGVQTTLQVQGAGSLTLSNSAVFNNMDVYGTSTLILPAVTNNTSLSFQGESTTTLTGNSGTVGGGNFYSAGGKLIIQPSGSGAAVSINSLGTTLGMDGEAEIVLDAGSNTSLTYTMGSTAQTVINSKVSVATASTFNANASGQDPTFILGSAQGISALGTTDKFVLLISQTVLDANGNTIANPTPVLNIKDGIWVPNNGGSVDDATYAQNDTVGGKMEATFLTYSGTGTSSDTGFTAYNFAAAGAVNSAFSTWTSTKEEDITTGEKLTASEPVFGLEIDSGGSLNLNGYTLTVGDSANAYMGYIILNGGSITGSTGSISLSQNTHFYADLDNATISASVNANKYDVAKDGPGTLFLNASNLSRVTVNQGAIDLGTLNSNVGAYFLHGGVIQGNGIITRTLWSSAGGVIFNTGNDYSNALGGGFSAHGGSLDVTLVDTTGSSNLVWGSTASFLQEGSVLNFGSTTSNNEVIFESNMDFGPTTNFNGLYSRVIDVTANSSDTGDPMAYADFTLLNGVLSSNSNPYAGLTKTGTGLLVLAPAYGTGSNTYTGATTIEQGMIEIVDDSDLGTAPTAAYALNASPGVSGNALTPGALEIDGGAGLGIGGLVEGDVTLSSNRQVLLASGATGATPAIFDVAGSTSLGYNTLYFGGTIADYINEKGSLEKQGGGTFNYSGTAANTGTFGVTAGTMVVSGSGSVNSASGVTINNKSSDPNATAQFNYSSTVGLSKAVTYGTGGGVFAYNSSAAYTGASTMALAAKDVIAGAGNLGLTALTINSGGTLEPGNIDGQTGTATVGTLKVGAVTLNNGGNYNFLIANAYGAAGVGYSTVSATSLNLTALTAPFDINLESLNASTGAPGTLSFNGYFSYDFLLFTTTAGITPETQANLNSDFAIFTSANNGATGFSPQMGTWSVKESSDDSELLLHYTAAPEPGTWAMLLGGLGLLVFIRRMRSRTE